MKTFQLTSNPKVEILMNSYPPKVKERLLNLRRLILEAAEELPVIQKLEETLKWGESSYLTKIGSTVRFDWKEKTPEQYALYFQCTSSLVPTFITVYNDLFKYEGTRAIVFNLDDKVPVEELKHCIKAALCYHKVKNLPLLGF